VQLLLQELRLLLGGDVWLENGKASQPQSRMGSKLLLLPWVIPGPSPVVCCSVPSRVPIGCCTVAAMMLSAGMLEALLAVTLGAGCNARLYDQLVNYSQPSVASAPAPRLSPQHEVEWLCGLAVLGALLNASDDAKTRLHEHMGIDKFAGLLLPLQTLPGCSKALPRLCLSACLGGAPLLPPSRPFVCCSRIDKTTAASSSSSHRLLGVLLADRESLEGLGPLLAELDEGKSLLIDICNFHVLSHLLLIYICKLHWDCCTMFLCQVNPF
jgi:hypothetical protein